MLGISMLCNIALAALVALREKQHADFEEEQRILNRCLRDEIVNLIRTGRLPLV